MSELTRFRMQLGYPSMDKPPEIVHYPDKEGMWVPYHQVANRIEELEAKNKDLRKAFEAAEELRAQYQQESFHDRKNLELLEEKHTALVEDLQGLVGTDVPPTEYIKKSDVLATIKKRGEKNG